MEKRITVLTSGGTQWWGTLLIALGGALVGGIFALAAGWLISRRADQSEKVARVRLLTAQLVSKGQALAGNAPEPETEIDEGDPPTDFDPAVRLVEVQYIEVSTELRWLTRRCNLGDEVAVLSGELHELVNTKWDSYETYRTQFYACVAQTEHIRDIFAPFAYMSRRQATRYLAGR